MDNMLHAQMPDDERISEREVRALIGMLDYLVAEVGRIQASSAQMSARCLTQARASLADVLSNDLVKTH